MTTARTLLVAFALSIVTFLPLVTYAAPANFFGPIISEGCRCDDEGAPSAPDWGCALQTIQNTVNLGISVAVLFAVLVFAYAGFLFMTSSFNAHNREKARTVMLHAVIGLLIALSAWLVVDFVMKALYNEDSQFGPWNTILSGGRHCLEVRNAPQAPAGQGGVTGNPGTPAQDGVIEEGELTHQQAVAYLSQHGINVSSSGNCSDQNNANCTSLQGIKSQALHQIAELKADCTAANNGQSCQITVTGGTETGHQTHGGGNRLDICHNSCPNSRVHAYIESLPHSGSVYYDPCGNSYFDEGDHWHVTVNSFCGTTR